MHSTGPTIIKKGGFLSAFAFGLFGFLTATVMCATGLGFYGLHVVNSSAGEIIGVGGNLIESLPEWREKLPPVLADALKDRREPGYRDNVELDVRLAGEPINGDDRYRMLVINATNRGEDTITLMNVRVVLVDENEVPIRSESVYAATPVTVEGEWRGPLMPGSTRRCSIPIWKCPENLTPTVEITDLRVWDAAAGSLGITG